MTDSEQVLQELSPLISPLFGALGGGIIRAREYFETNGLKHDPWLFTGLVRAHAIQFIDLYGADLMIWREDIPNNGISLLFGRYHLKIFKADQGELPVPGSSKRRLAFFNQRSVVQKTFLPILFPADVPSHEFINLVMLWDVDNLHNLAGIQISYPRSANQYAAGEYWRVPVPHPAETLHSMSPFNDINEEDDFDELRLIDERQSGSGSAK